MCHRVAEDVSCPVIYQISQISNRLFRCSDRTRQIVEVQTACVFVHQSKQRMTLSFHNFDYNFPQWDDVRCHSMLWGGGASWQGSGTGHRGGKANESMGKIGSVEDCAVD